MSSAIWDADRCEHAETTLRMRTLSNGTTAVYEQCTKCGTGIRAVKKESVQSPDDLPRWDELIAESYHQERREEIDRLRGQEDAARREEWAGRSSRYLNTAEWKARRRRVLARCRGVCEGCGDEPATEVHHLTYDNYENEFLWELVGICRRCHERETTARRERNERSKIR